MTNGYDDRGGEAQLFYFGILLPFNMCAYNYGNVGGGASTHIESVKKS